MNVIVSSGFAICGGCLKFEETNRTLSITASDFNYDRIDTVVMRLNDNDAVRACDLYIVAGTPASSPVRPELNRQSSVWEIGLADLFIAKNTSIITNARITDTRLETARCGVISSVSQWDTTTIYQQIQDDLAGFKSGEEAEFLAWFEEMKDQLTEDAAGNLQTEIGTLASLTTTDKSSLVAAINWLHANMSTTAEDTSYDNTESGMTATNVQDAVDELNDSLVASGEHFYYDVKDGVRGYNTEAARGADTFRPFKSGYTIPIWKIVSAGGADYGAPGDRLILDVSGYNTVTIGDIVLGASATFHYISFNDISYTSLASVPRTIDVSNVDTLTIGIFVQMPGGLGLLFTDITVS